MAAIGLLTYTLPPGLKVKNAFSKIPINGTNIIGLDHQNSIVTKIENIGMIGGEVVVVRKKQMPLSESNIGNIQQAPQQGLVQPPPAKRPKFMTGETPTAAAKKTPQPQAVARRNARERRRVKQVNDGFTTLRQHIPDEVAAAFEAAGNGRGTAKKLSKVETLRMAVEYIRSLERLLEIDSSDTAGNVDLFSNTVIKSESCSPPLMLGDGQCSESSYDPSADESATIYYTDTLPDITMLNGQQYIRIPGTNTYQLITNDVFENEENIHPQVDVSYDGYTRAGVTDQHAAIASASTIIAPAPISPPPSSSDFNDSVAPPQSISPASSILDTHHHQPQPIPLQQQRLHDHLLQQVHVRMMEDGLDGRGARIKREDHSFNIYQSHLAPSSSPINDVDAHGYVDAQLYEGGGGMLHLKREVDEDDDMVVLDTTGAVLSEESMIESIDWWHDHTPQSDDSAIMS